jgi:polyhydroxybutyrate depolymerase
MAMFCACLALPQGGCGSSASSASGNPGTSNCDFSKKGAQQSCSLAGRTSLLYLPPASCSGALPVVIYLHGAPGDIHEGNNNGWPATAAKDCLIEVNAKGSVLSSGVESWHIYDDTTGYSGAAPDDVAQLKSVVVEIETGTTVDAKAIFAVGFSAGGFMASRVAAEGGDVFAATFPWAATLYMQDVGGSTGLPASVATPTNIDERNGTADSTIPICGLTNSNLTVSSVDTTLNWWMGVLGCTNSMPSTNVCVSGQPVLMAKTLSGCNGGVTVQWSSVAGANHSWPSGLNDTVWSYLNSHRKP